ncbi:hypothetical protein [Selenomonas ruminantium]|uniref:hypothetical protein n=1 Tax=Selenomonas ruminantium TaxID=971 RepID=UPI00047AE8D2|nr:hypothetical protein [Selenomonas ruminantium]
MNPKYEQEIQEFYKNFADWKEKRLVLYGIGRYTATLLDGVEGFNIIGLMDRDPSNIGKIYFGLPILADIETKENADAIIINTAGTYWKLIYQRIKDLGVPVYYRNGEKAKNEQICVEEFPYWNTSFKDFREKILGADVISFDFFDTLFSRRVCNPKDVLILLEEKLKRRFPQYTFSWIELRNKALQNISSNYCLDELYDEIARLSKIPTEITEFIKQLEINLESELLIPRNPVLECMKQAIIQGKNVYVITDMYLPESFFEQALKKQGIHFKKEHILVSGALKKNKADGTLWIYYKEMIGSRIAVHVGDHLIADIEQARIQGIDTYYVANAWKLLTMSTLRNMKNRICNGCDSLLMGSVFSKMFQNPFALNSTKGIVRIESCFEMGYCVFAPVLLTFFSWIMQQIRKDGIHRLVFMSRDGYFLKEDFEEYIAYSGEQIETCYIGISRQLVMTAAVENEADLWRLVDMPYTGTWAELLEDRFEIHDALIETREDIKKYIPEIMAYVNGVRKRYRKYVDSYHFTEMDAIVDIGYYGNNQRYLNKISNTNMKGYYFNANLSQENDNICHQVMKPCFQAVTDITGKDSGVLKYQIFLESFLTAPYGMVKDIAEDGSLVCKEKRQNQINFYAKEKINEGVKTYIRDVMAHVNDIGMKQGKDLVDEFYRTCFEGNLEFSDLVKKSFYNDNAMMHRMEANLFC